MTPNLPKQLRSPELRFCLIRKGQKKPFESQWQKNGYKYDDAKLIAHLEAGGNYGVIAGHGNLRIRDLDDVELAKQVIGNTSTFTVKTGSGGLHSYYFCDYSKNHILTNGELRAKDYQCVGPGSIHPNGNSYEVIDEKDIGSLSEEELLSKIKPFIKSEKKESDGNEYKITDESRSGREFAEVCKLIRQGLTREQIFERMMAFSKWAVPHHPSYREKTYEKALLSIQKNSKIKTSNAYDYKKDLILWQFNDFLKLKEDKSFLIQKFIYPKTVTMIFSPPGEFKSILGLWAGLCIATGKDWLRCKTKKMPVLYCDKENNDQLLKKRLQSLHNASGYKRKKFPLYILRRQGDLLNPDFRDRLKEAIQKNNIKVVFFDTLHRFADYDENKSDDLNRIYTQVFQPLVEDYGCSIIFLHHTKKDGGYRGTGDFLGMVDTAYSIIRTKTAKAKKSNKFRIVNEKSRSGEIEEIRGEIDFSEDESYIKIIRMNEEQEEKKEIDKLKETTERIKEFVPEGRQLKRKDIITSFDMAKIEYSLATVKRSLKWLVDNGYFDYDSKKNLYWKVIR